MPVRYIVKTTGPIDRPLARALSLALALARVDGSEVSLFAPAARPLDILTLRPLLPLAKRVELNRWGETKVSAVTVRLITSWTIERPPPRAVIVVVGACEAKLATVEDFGGWGVIIAVPRWSGRCERWQSRWSPVVVEVEPDIPIPPA